MPTLENQVPYQEVRELSGSMFLIIFCVFSFKKFQIKWTQTCILAKLMIRRHNYQVFKQSNKLNKRRSPVFGSELATGMNFAG